MGAGCYYTTGEYNTIKCFWIDVPESEDDDDLNQWEYDDLRSELTELLHDYNANYSYYKFSIESSYYGDSFVFNVKLSEYAPAEIYGLLVCNMEKSYRKLARLLVKHGYSLRTSNGAWMSMGYVP